MRMRAIKYSNAYMLLIPWEWDKTELVQLFLDEFIYSFYYL